MTSSEEGLFSRPAPRVFATLASASFFDVFVAQMVEEIDADDPFSLADALKIGRAHV